MATIEVKTDVTGSVWKIERKVGDAVEDGATVMIIESMKMEIPVLTEGAGHITEIRVAEGEAVQEGQVVAVLDDGPAR